MFDPSSWLELLLNFSKFDFFGTKIGTKFAFFNRLALNLLEAGTLKLRPNSF